MAEPTIMITMNAAEFNIKFNNTHVIITTVTADPRVLTSWLSKISSASLIGLNAGWNANHFSQRYINYPFVYTLQLCTTTDFYTFCLIFQFYQCAVPLPRILFDFLNNPRITFVGVGIQFNAFLLSLFHGLIVRNMVELSDLVTDKIYGAPREMQLEELAKFVLNVKVTKPSDVKLSGWDNHSLSYRQIQYACMDAFLPYEIGKILISLPSLPRLSTCNTNLRLAL